MKRISSMIVAIVGTWAIAISMIAAVSPAVPEDTAVVPAKQNWPQANGDLDNSRFSTLTQINTQNVKNLGVAWQSDKFDDGASARVTPVVHDGVMFVTAGTKVYALDAKTGKTLWKYALTAGAPTGGRGVPSGSPNREGVGVGDGKVFVATTDAHMLALDEKTGALLWNVLADKALTPAMRGGISANPAYVNGVIYTAITLGEARYRGRMMALDAKDGHELWHWDAVPGPGEPGHETWTKGLPGDSPWKDIWTMGGADCWQAPTIDLDLGLAYYSTGNPSPNRQAAQVRPGDNLYASSTVALDIKTGKLRWYFQTIHHDMWEGDLGTPNISYTAQVNGAARKGLAVYRPDGTLFLLDRATGKPIWPVEERPVRQSELMKASPTQPYPVGRTSLTERDCSTLKAPPGFIVRCESGLFQPPTNDPPNVLSYYPGVRNSPMSYSPQTGYFYIQGSDELTWAWVSNSPPTFDLGITALRNRVPDIEKQDIMVYEAVDPKTYKVVWKKTLPMPLSIYGAGGFITTAGGLAFHRLEDGNMVAWDAKTGDELWKFQTGVPDSATIQTASPMTYEVDGQQYMSIILLNQVWSFRLGGDMAQRAAPKFPPREGPLLGPIQDSQVIRAHTANDFDFRPMISPLKARVRVGSEVTFLNNGAEIHDWVAEDESWTTGRLLPRQQALLTFDKPGTYMYHDKLHPYIFGMLYVVAGGAPGAINNANAAAAQPGGRAGGGGAGGGFAAQVARGKAAYEQQCSSCHQADLTGNDFIPALAGSAFMSRWQGRPAKDLLDKTSTTMPTTTPGSLSAQTYLDLIAFLLQSNELPQRGAVTAETLNALTLP